MLHAGQQGLGRKAGFTIVELVVTITVLTVLACLLIPSVMQSRSAARQNVCLNNMRNIGVAYHSDFAKHGRSMSAYDWRLSVLEQMEQNGNMLLCPDDSREFLYDVDEYTVYIVNNRRSIPLKPGPWCCNNVQTCICVDCCWRQLAAVDLMGYRCCAWSSWFGCGCFEDW